MTSFRQKNETFGATPSSRISGNVTKNWEREAVKNSNEGAKFPWMRSSMLEAVTKLTPVLKITAPLRAAPYQRTWQLKNGARAFQQPTRLPASGCWDVADGGGLISY